MPAADWHPRRNAYPVEWLCKNGLWAEPYAVINKIDVRRPDKTWGHRYQLREWDPGPGKMLGEFNTGDEAATFAWKWVLEREDERHRRAATRK